MDIITAIRVLQDLLAQHGNIEIRIQVATYKPDDPNDFEILL